MFASTYIVKSLPAKKLQFVRGEKIREDRSNSSCCLDTIGTSILLVYYYNEMIIRSNRAIERCNCSSSSSSSSCSLANMRENCPRFPAPAACSFDLTMAGRLGWFLSIFSYFSSSSSSSYILLLFFLFYISLFIAYPSCHWCMPLAGS